MYFLKSPKFWVLFVLTIAGFWLCGNELEVSLTAHVIMRVVGIVCLASAYFLCEGWTQNGDIDFGDDDDWGF